jgi:uncharacterized protein (TIGR00255 family)
MTGFGAAEGPVAGGRLRMEIRTVNHRHFNLSLRLPAELAALEADVRERLRKDFDRGHVAVHACWTELPERVAGFAVDIERARLIAARLREVQTALGLSGDVTLDLVLRQPQVISAAVEESDTAEVAWRDVEPVVAHAADECRVMRAREGEALATELRHRLDLLAGAADTIERQAPERLVRERDRLRTNVAALLDGRPLDEGRLAQEVALLADRLDITEELVRLRTHVVAARDALAADTPVGKQLGFLAQELGREVNTIGSKANDADITGRVIAMKGELEKFREQLENLE